MCQLNADPKFDAMMELFAALYMAANALYFHHLVRLCVKLFGTKSLPPRTVLGMRIAAGIFAIILGFVSLHDIRKAT
jgi:hypothetical protein